MTTLFQKTDKIAILGRSGCGKTFLCRKIQDMYSRIVVIDLMHEYGPEDGEVVSDFDKFSDLLSNYKKSCPQFFKIIFQFSPDSQIKDKLLNEILKLCYHFGDIQIIIEEIQEYTNPHYLQQYLQTCLFTGRHKGISLIFTTQRPGTLNKSILSQCQHIFIGQIHERNDLKYISNYLPEKTEKELIDLKPREFFYFFPGIKKLIKINNNLKNI